MAIGWDGMGKIAKPADSIAAKKALGWPWDGMGKIAKPADSIAAKKALGWPWDGMGWDGQVSQIS